MAGQSGAQAGQASQPGQARVDAVQEAHHSKPTSWAAVIVIIIGFIIGGLGLIFGNWWLFWGGGAVAVIGGIFGLVNGILQDVH